MASCSNTNENLTDAKTGETGVDERKVSSDEEVASAVEKGTSSDGEGASAVVKGASSDGGGALAVEEGTSVIPDAFGNKEARRAWAAKVEFEDYILVHERVRAGKGVPSGYNFPDFELMSCSAVKGPDGNWPVCCHPEGFHEWHEKNPWAKHLQFPVQQTPDQDTESEVGMDFYEHEYFSSSEDEF